MQLWGCDLVGIMEMWRDSSHDRKAAVDGQMSFRKDRLERRWSCPLCEKTAVVLGLCLGVDDEPTERACG